MHHFMASLPKWVLTSPKKNSSHKVIFPKYNSNIGNPVILPKSYFETLKNLKGDFGARSQIKNKDYVTVKTDIGTTLDIDTKEEFNKQKNYKL